jgi:hypothetical protein
VSSKTGGSGLKPLLQKPSFCRSGFSRDLYVVENQRLGVAGAASVATLASSKTGGSGLKSPSVSRNSFRPSYRRRGFRRDPSRHRRQRFGAVGAALAATFCAIENPAVRSYQSRFSCDPCVVEDRGSGRKPLLQRPIFVGAASAATFASSKTIGWELPERLPSQPCVIEDGRFGAKAPPPETIFL